MDGVDYFVVGARLNGVASELDRLINEGGRPDIKTTDGLKWVGALYQECDWNRENWGKNIFDIPDDEYVELCSFATSVRPEFYAVLLHDRYAEKPKEEKLAYRYRNADKTIMEYLKSGCETPVNLAQLKVAHELTDRLSKSMLQKYQMSNGMVGFAA